MADKIVIEAEVKSNIGDVSKDASSLAGEFKVMGVSLNSVKAGFVSVGRTAKASFATIKAGIMSTGIGALVIAFTSLATFLTKTKKGAELLEVAFAGVGAAISVIVDRVSKFGGAIVKLFQGNVKGALIDVKGAFTGIGTEIANDTKNAIALKQAFIALRDSERDLNVETAQRRAEIEALKLIAEDVSKSETERLAAAEEAFKIENDLLDKRVANAEEALRLQQEEMALGENMQEDLDKEAELLINLANIRAESTTKQIELNNKINSIEAEVAAKRAERNQARLDEIAAEKKASDDLYNAQISQADNWLAKVERDAQTEFDVRINLNKAIGSSIGALGNLMEEGSAASKALALTEIGVNAAVGYMQGLNIAQKSAAAAGPGAALAFPIFYAMQVASVLGAVNQARQVLGSGGGGGLTSPTAPSPSAQPPAPQMMSGAFELSGGVAPEPTRAYVVTDEMTNSQNQLANIRRRATI